MSTSLFSLFLFISLSSALAAGAPPQSGLDSQAAGSVQTYPLGSLATGTLGYGQELWKEADKENNADFWQYGYLRPFAEWKTAALINRFTGALEFFPISILGLSGGGGIDLRNYNKYSGFNCQANMCDHSVTFQYAQAQMIVGYEKFLGVLTGRYDWYRAESDKRPFYDEMSYLIGQPGQDNMRTLNLLALYRQNDTWGFGGMAIYQRMIYSGANSSSVYGILNYTQGPWRGTVGLGAYQSSHQVQNPSMIFSINYTAIKGIGLLN